jgi:homogentisate 1,2-dioxygenase
MRVAPGEFCVIQRGMKFSVDLVDNNGHGPARGYMCEVYDAHFEIPELGPIGGSGLANPRHFKTPVAFFDDASQKTSYIQVQKFGGQLFSCPLDYSPYNVVGWMGNYVPYKYDLELYNTINSVSYDHLDPSIFTVLTAQTHAPGVACLDFVVFPPRWAVQEHTFRPPYYHKNCMTEFMGNIMGKYDAKPEGFLPGGGSLHSCMMGHGPDGDTYKKMNHGEQKPVRMSDDDLAFMFESCYTMKLTKWADKDEMKNMDYYQCWMNLDNEYNGKI